MISITKTAYPRFKKSYNEEELTKIFEPTDKELRFCHKNARGKTQRLTLLTLLKSHQYLGYMPNTVIVPKSLRQYLSTKLDFSKNLQLIELTGVSSGYAQKVVTSYKVANFNVDYWLQPHKTPFEYLLLR